MSSLIVGDYVSIVNSTLTHYEEYFDCVLRIIKQCDIKENGNSVFETVCVHDPYFRYPPRYWYEKNLKKTTHDKNNLKAELINRKIKQLEMKFLNRKMNYYG